MPKAEEIDIELERRVEELYNSAVKFPESKKIYLHSKRTHDSDYDWEVEEIRRCINGFDGMCGKMYFYFNYCYIIDNKRGKILPDFRTVDNEWFKLIESCRKENSGYGVVCVKRRRGGFSWKEAADVMHDCLFTPFFNVGMNSKTERDSIQLFKKCKFIYDNLPEFMRVSVDGGKTKLSMLFASKTNDKFGNPILEGNMSEIICVPPTDSAYEGLMLGKWVCDEAGKIPNLIQMWSFTEDCLSSGGVERVGIPIIFGTSGEVDKNGAGLRELWYKHEVYSLKQFFFAGYMGLIVDKYGNDDIKAGIRHILLERKRLLRVSQKQYNDYLQKYPLTPEEAFMQLTGGGVGDPVKINNQMISLEKNPASARRGYFRFGREGEPVSVFIPDNSGSSIIYEIPDQNKKSLYLAGCDPADHDETGEGSSLMSMFIYKKQDGLSGRHIVFEYTDRPKLAATYYEQALLALIYYNECKILIENNRYRMISSIQEWGWGKLLQPSPKNIGRIFQSGPSTYGVRMNEYVKNYMIELIDEYINDNCDLIPSMELLKEFLAYGSENTDRVMAFGLCLIYEKEDKTLAKNSEELLKTTPSFVYRKIGGKIVRVKK